MLRALLLVLLSADVSGPLAEYLHAPAGSPEEVAAVEKLRAAHAEDPLAVEEAVRSFSGFPPAEPGLRRVRIPLSGVSVKAGPVEDVLAWVWVPRGYDPSREWPALVVSHGTGGTAEALARGLAPLAEKHGLLMIAPQEEAGPRDGWGSTEYQHAIHLQALFWLKRSYNVDDARVFVHGGSRGGHASWELSFSYPDLFAGAIPVSGTLPNRHFRYLVNLRHVGVLDMQGARDQPAMVENARAAAKLLEGLGYDMTYLEDPEHGHSFPVDWDRVGAWIEKRRRPAHPKSVVLAATRDARARAYWLRIEGLDTRKLENPPAASYDARKGTPSQAEMVRIVRKHYDRYRGLVRGEVKGNSIILSVSKAPRVVVYLHQDLLDLGEKVVVKVNGRVRQRALVPRSLDVLLERVKTTGERDLLYHAAVKVREAAADDPITCRGGGSPAPR